jgi:hypothetical protein
MRPYYVNCGKLRILRPILKEWIRINRRYCERESWKDCVWWNNERALTGILAAAVWTLGEVSLEEYVTPKIRKGKKRSGRCDLLIDIGGDKLACEVKQKFLTPKNHRNDDVRSVKYDFGWACDDARDLHPREGRRLGICFVTPRFLHSQIPYESYLKNFLTSLQKLEFDAIAWCFPPKARELKWFENNKTYPGSIILIREVFRSASSTRKKRS